MNIIHTEFEGLLIFEPTLFSDDRGYFYESFSQKKLKGVIPITDVIQENFSQSKKNVLRGLHFQMPPFAQSKLVTVIKGSVTDVVVDLRRNSNKYGQSFFIELSEINKKQLYIPRGFAHGFLSKEDDTIFTYKCDNPYHQDSERTLCWNDKDLNIKWDVDDPILSKKDAENCLRFSDFESPF